jgi:hypothetical protein
MRSAIPAATPNHRHTPALFSAGKLGKRELESPDLEIQNAVVMHLGRAKAALSKHDRICHLTASRRALLKRIVTRLQALSAYAALFLLLRERFRVEAAGFLGAATGWAVSPNILSM